MHHLKSEIYNFRDALDRLGTIAAFDKDLRFMTVAPGFFDLFGYTDEDVFSQPISFLDHAGGSPALYQHMMREVQSGGTWIGDVTCRHKDASSVEVRISIAPSSQGGEIKGYLAQFQRSYAQSSRVELSDVLYRYRAGFNKIAALAIISSVGIIEEVNELFLTMYGYDRSALLGKHFSILQTTVDKNAQARFWAALTAGEIWSEEASHLRKNGQNIYVRSTVAPASHAGGLLDGLDACLMINQDITAEWELRDSQRDLAIESGKQQMLARTIHNIGNFQMVHKSANHSVGESAKGLLEACAMAQTYYTDADPAEKEHLTLGFLEVVRSCCEQIAACSEEANKAINETAAILHSWRNEMKNVRPVSNESVKEFIQATLKNFNVQAALNQIGFVISELHEAEVQWPVVQVRQIVHNLLLNAQQQITSRVDSGALPARQGRICLGVVSACDSYNENQEKSTDILIQIRDNGGGFSVSLAQLFTPKFTTKTGGSGVGLHTSAIMAQSMGGSITAANIQLEGSPGALFELRLPRVVAEKMGEIAM